MSLSRKRLLVVGASSGIGRAIGLGAAAAGAAVAFAARRRDLVDEAASLGGGGCIGLACDVRDEGSCGKVVADAAGGLGGLDLLVYAPAMLPLGPLTDTDAATWRAVLDTNVVGAATVTSAAMPHLVEAGGRVAFLSSDAVLRPRPGLVAYVASKAALDVLLAGFRAEVPEVGFTRVLVGPTNTGVPPLWDLATVGPWLERWAAAGYSELQGVMEPDDVAAEVLRALTSPVRVDDLLLQPPPAA